MSGTSLDIYPFREVTAGEASAAITHYFAMFSGLSDSEIVIAVINENGAKQLRYLDANEPLSRQERVWYAAFENKYVDAGVSIHIREVTIERPETRPPQMYLSDFRIKRSPAFLLNLCTALGMAKAMQCEWIFHGGDFGWLVGEHRSSPYTTDIGDSIPDDFWDEFDIPLALVDQLYANRAKKASSLEEGLNNFFDQFVGKTKYKYFD